MKQTNKVTKDSNMKWYICTDFFHKGGKIVMGAFETQDLALRVRTMLEKETYPVTYFVDSKEAL